MQAYRRSKCQRLLLYRYLLKAEIVKAIEWINFQSTFRKQSVRSQQTPFVLNIAHGTNAANNVYSHYPWYKNLQKGLVPHNTQKRQTATF